MKIETKVTEKGRVVLIIDGSYSHSMTPDEALAASSALRRASVNAIAAQSADYDNDRGL